MFEVNPSVFAKTTLLSYHSFTRTSKPSVFSKMCSVYSVSPEEIVQGAVQGPLHLRMILHILQHVYQGYADASIILSSFHTPEWLKPWCSKWGFATSKRCMTTIYTVHAFPHAPEAGVPEIHRQPPVRTLLVPSFPAGFGS